MLAVALSYAFIALFVAAGLAMIIFAGPLSRFFTARLPRASESVLFRPTARSFRFLGTAWVLVGGICLLGGLLTR